MTETRNTSLYEAGFDAQKLAFAPVSFMVCLCMKRMGLWDALEQSIGAGASTEEIANLCDISPYAAKVLLESSLAIGSVRCEDGRYHKTKLGHVLSKDEMTQINFDFVYDVCFKGLFHLEDALRTGKPSGLKELGTWPTVYEGLKDLKPDAQKAWFKFDHFYSDSAFQAALPILFEKPIRTLMDVGGNTGRFTKQVLAFRDDVSVTIADLPQQISLAKEALKNHSCADRIRFHPVNLLEPKAELATGHEIIWMSQFLVCFSEPEVTTILAKAKAALAEGGEIAILDTFIDRQPTEAATYGVVQTSPYFTVIANGNSKMYDFKTIERLASLADLKLNRIYDNLGLSHSLAMFS